MNRLLHRLYTIFKVGGIAIYALVGAYVTLLSGCKSVMPTRTVPFAEEVGIHVPNFKGWTFVFLNEMRYKYESGKVKMYGEMMEITHQATFEVYDFGVEWGSMLLTGSGLTAVGLLPSAFRRVPKGYKKEDNQPDVAS